MAQKKKAAGTGSASQSTITRIKATDDTPAKKPKETTPLASAKETAAPSKTRKKPSSKGIARPFVATGGYFKGAWQELKQVRWPTRRATWSLTFAVLAYSLFFVVLVLLLDALFKYLFELMLGK